MIIVLLFKGRGVFSQLIRWQTRSQYSHSAVLIEKNTIIEAWSGSNTVREKLITDWRDIDVFYADCSLEQRKKIISFLRSKIGHKYDYSAVIRFITKSPTKNNERYFCSELVFEAFKSAGINLLERIDGSIVSPSLLSYSPKLKFYGQLCKTRS